jgi:ureidoacrylate peracid hydrolase
MCAMLKTLEEKVAPQHSALLVVDVQRDFCANDGAFGSLGRDLSRVQEILPTLERLVEAARSADVKVIFLRYTQTAATESEVHLEQRARGRADIAYCVEDTPGSEFYRIRPSAGEAVVTKHRYSGFINTDLDLILRSGGVRTLVMTGVATNGCVEATARDGFMHDYYIVFTADGAATYSEELHNATLANIRDAYGVVTTCDQLIAIWSNSGDYVSTLPGGQIGRH